MKRSELLSTYANIEWIRKVGVVDKKPLTCGNNVEHAWDALRAEFVPSPAQQSAVVRVRMRRVVGNTFPSCAAFFVRTKRFDTPRLHRRAVKPPSEPHCRRIRVHFARYQYLLVPLGTVHALLLALALGFVCKTMLLWQLNKTYVHHNEVMWWNIEEPIIYQNFIACLCVCEKQNINIWSE